MTKKPRKQVGEICSLQHLQRKVERQSAKSFHPPLQDNTRYGRLSSKHLVSRDSKKLIFSSHFYHHVKIIATNCNCQASPFSRDNRYYSREKAYSKTVKGIIAKDLEDVSKKALPRRATLALGTRILRRQRYNYQLTLQFQKPVNESKFSEQSA